MLLSNFSLTHFRNYKHQLIDCAPRLNCFVGHNGSGKTNLLKAIYFLCMGKEHDGAADHYALQHGSDFFRLAGHFEMAEDQLDRIVVKVQKRKRKIIERNNLPYDKLSDHIGRYPVVMVTPDDVNLIHEGSEMRRRLLDNSLCQTQAAYLHKLITYNKVLAQRNALLKQHGGQPLPEGLLDIYDEQMAEPAQYIHEARRAFIEPFTKLLQAAYQAISDQAEEVDIFYQSQLEEENWYDLLDSRAEKDRILQRTTGGIHRDDLLFTQGGHPLKRVASQGQLKTFVLSLKLAQYQLLQAQTGRQPILLLDDIFDKLDQARVNRLLNLILEADYGQVFLTDTSPERVERLLAERSQDGTDIVYKVENGQAERITKK